MARIVGGIGTSHVPTIAMAFDEGEQEDPDWTPLFKGYEPVREILTQRSDSYLRAGYSRQHPLDDGAGIGSVCVLTRSPPSRARPPAGAGRAPQPPRRLQSIRPWWPVRLVLRSFRAAEARAVVAPLEAGGAPAEVGPRGRGGKSAKTSAERVLGPSFGGIGDSTGPPGEPDQSVSWQRGRPMPSHPMEWRGAPECQRHGHTGSGERTGSIRGARDRHRMLRFNPGPDQVPGDRH